MVVNCEHLICKQCVLAGDPQSHEITCPACQEKVYLSKDRMKVNNVALNLIKSVKKHIKHLVCPVHKDKDLEYYCSHEQQMFCLLCVQAHREHVEFLSIFTPQDIISHTKKIYEEMKNFREKLSKSMEELK